MRVLFVCQGNICRSPLAEAAAVKIAAECGLDGWEFDSAGTSSCHVGEQADSRMRKAARAAGVEIDHRARQIERGDFERFDLILAMDRNNARDILRLAQQEDERRKVSMFRDFDPEGSGDVPDPWYGGDDGFRLVVRMVTRTCLSLIERAGRIR